MGNIFVRLIALVSALILIVLAIGYMLPRDYKIESSIEIAAQPSEVFPMIDSLPNWALWSMFSEERIEGLKIEYGETKQGVGAVQTWVDSRGSGKLWISDSEPPSTISYKLNFVNFPTMESRISLQPVEDGTLVTWTSSGRLPNGPFYGFSGLLFPGQMTHEYQQCLLRLKSEIE